MAAFKSLDRLLWVGSGLRLKNLLVPLPMQ